MNFSRRSSLLALAGAIALAAPLATPAQAQTKLKMVLNWKYQGPQGWFFLAEDKGYFKAEGLEIQIDQGDGSATPIPKVASGTYDIGFGDINALIEFAARKPEEAPIAVYVMYNRPPFTIAVKADSPIKTPKDLEGKTLGGAANDGALKLFPAFAKLTKIDESKITITNFQPNLREQMLMRGQADGVFGYVNTIRFSAKLSGIDPDKELRWINYGDYGMDLYSNAHHLLEEVREGKSEGGGGLPARAQQGDRRLDQGPEGLGRGRAQARAADQDGRRARALRCDDQGRDEPSGDRDDRPRRHRRRAHEEGDRHPGRRQQAAAHAAISEIFTREFLPPKADRPTKLIDVKTN